MAVITSKYARAWRVGAIVLCLAGYAIVLSFPIDDALSLSVLARRLLLVGGIIGGTLSAWAVQYTFHVRMGRRALIPWGMAGGVATVLLVAAQTNLLGEHRAFVVSTIAHSVLLCLTVRWTIDLVLGPIDGPASWAGPRGEQPIPREVTHEEVSKIPVDALRPVWTRDVARTVSKEPATPKLVSETDPHERETPAWSKRRRNSS